MSESCSLFTLIFKLGAGQGVAVVVALHLLSNSGGHHNLARNHKVVIRPSLLVALSYKSVKIINKIA